MHSPLHRCLLLGHPKGLPFLGHFYLHLKSETSSLEIAGSIAVENQPEEAWEIAQLLHAHLKTVTGASALELIRGCWDVLQTIPRKDFGPKEGKDLSLLMRAEDSNGGAISATGLAEIWVVDGKEARRIADATTSESSHAGLPEHPPKALPFSGEDALFLGVSLGQKTDAPTAIQLLKGMGEEA